MTEKQKRFVDEYIATGNASQAARRAGYSKKNSNNIGSENLAKLGNHIQSRLEELGSERIATTAEVLERLTNILRGQEVETIVTPNGKKIKAPARITERLQAANHLLKVAGAYRDKVDVKFDSAELFVQTLLKIDAEADTIGAG